MLVMSVLFPDTEMAAWKSAVRSFTDITFRFKKSYLHANEGTSLWGQHGSE